MEGYLGTERPLIYERNSNNNWKIDKSIKLTFNFNDILFNQYYLNITKYISESNLNYLIFSVFS